MANYLSNPNKLAKDIRACLDSTHYGDKYEPPYDPMQDVEDFGQDVGDEHYEKCVKLNIRTLPEKIRTFAVTQDHLVEAFQNYGISDFVFAILIQKALNQLLNREIERIVDEEAEKCHTT